MFKFKFKYFNQISNIGVLVAGAGIALSSYTHNPIWDGVASIGVGALLCGVGITLLRSNGSFLLGRAIEKPMQEDILKLLRNHPSVEGVQNFKSRYVGPAQFAITVEVDFR